MGIRTTTNEFKETTLERQPLLKKDTTIFYPISRKRLRIIRESLRAMSIDGLSHNEDPYTRLLENYSIMYEYVRRNGGMKRFDKFVEYQVNNQLSGDGAEDYATLQEMDSNQN